ncbi:MAG: hypothetical protein ACK5PP_06680 [Acidimicrobiales bacterium]
MVTTAPFVPVRAGTEHAGPFEAALHLAGRWKGALVVALAGLTTIAVVTVVTVYRGAAPDDLAAREHAAAGAPGVNAVAAQPDRSTTSPPTTSLADVDGAVSAAETGGGEGTASTRDAATPESDDARTFTEPSASGNGGSATGSATAGAPAATEGASTTETTAPPAGPSTTIRTGPAAPTTVQTPTGGPAVDAPTALPHRVQAETGTTSGSARVRTDHPGYTATGYVGDLITPGSGVALPSVVTGPVTMIRVRYATPPFGGSGDRTVTMMNGPGVLGRITFTPTSGPDQWATVDVAVDLPADVPVELSLVVEPTDSGWVNLDWIELG